MLVNSQETNTQQSQQISEPSVQPSVQAGEMEQKSAEESNFQEAQSEIQPENKQEPAKRTKTDRIAELETKIARMEAIYQLQGQNVVDMEVCTDLLLKGYTLDQLKQSKPYLFSNSVVNQGVVRQPPKVVSETQIPKPQPQSQISSEGFVKALANMLISKF